MPEQVISAALDAKPASRLSGLLDWRHSLLVAVVATSAASVVLISALLFFAIDHLVSQQFEGVRAERMARVSDQVRATVARELDALRNLGELLGNDAELINATYYHLYLDGEAEHPAAALRRISAAFHLDAARLWGEGGRLLAAAPGGTLPIAPPAEMDRPQARIVWVEGQPWLSAAQPITRAGNTLALLWLGRPLVSVLATTFPPGGELSVSLIRPDATALGMRVTLADELSQPIWLDVAVDDSVGRALATVKHLLAWLLPAAGLGLAMLLGWALHRQLNPLRELTQAVSAVGRGDFGRQLPGEGRNEIAQLVRAFNAMSGDLAKLRELERQAQQQERLSAIGRMAARVAHDINNPLAVIRGVAELMQKQAGQSGDVQGGEDSRLILHHIERCKRTVDHLLDYGRTIRLRTEVTDLNELVGAMVARWRGQFGNLVFHFHAAHTALLVQVDPYQLERVFDNLFANAREAAPGSPVEVRLLDNGGRAEVHVIDRGPGFSAEARAHLFEPFYTTKRGGNGLGLASCLGIIRAHGGEMTVGESDHGEVVVSLPLHGEAALPRAPG